MHTVCRNHGVSFSHFRTSIVLGAMLDGFTSRRSIAPDIAELPTVQLEALLYEDLVEIL